MRLFLILLICFCSANAEESKYLFKESLFGGLSIYRDGEEKRVSEKVLIEISGDNEELQSLAIDYGKKMQIGNSISIVGLLAIGAAPFVASELESTNVFLGMLGGGTLLTFYGASIQLDARNKAYKIVYTLNNF